MKWSRWWSIFSEPYTFTQHQEEAHDYAIKSTIVVVLWLLGCLGIIVVTAWICS